MTGLLIRDCAPGEARALGEVFHAAVREGAAGAYSEAQRAAWSPAPPDDPEWEARLRDHDTVVAESDAGIIGFMTLDRSRCLIDLAFVHPRWARRGVASALYAVIEGRARAAGLTALVTEASEISRPFFIRHGWTVEGRQDVELNGVQLHNYPMRKSLRERDARAA